MEIEQSLLNQGMRVRFLEILHQLDLSWGEAAKKLECDENHMIEIEKGHCELSEETIVMLYTKLNINLNWLFLGVGWMFRTTGNQTTAELVDNCPKVKKLMKALEEEKEKLKTEREELIKLQNMMKEHEEATH